MLHCLKEGLEYSGEACPWGLRTTQECNEWGRTGLWIFMNKEATSFSDLATHRYGTMCLPTWRQQPVKESLKVSPTKCFTREMKNEWKWLLWLQMFSWIKLFKSQNSPWRKWCPPNYQVQKGSHLLCCPLPMMLGGLVRLHLEGAWFSQSQSSRLWPVPCCHEQITRSCQSPAESQRQRRRIGKQETITKTVLFLTQPYVFICVF